MPFSGIVLDVLYLSSVDPCALAHEEEAVPALSQGHPLETAVPGPLEATFCEGTLCTSFLGGMQMLSSRPLKHCEAVNVFFEPLTGSFVYNFGLSWWYFVLFNGCAFLWLPLGLLVCKRKEQDTRKQGNQGGAKKGMEDLGLFLVLMERPSSQVP